MEQRDRASQALTIRQERFVSALLGEAMGSVVRAARIAGYKHPHVDGTRTSRLPQVAARIEAARKQIAAEGVAVLANRIAAQNERWTRLNEVIHARAEDMAHVPGGSTGLLVREPHLVRVYEEQAYGPGDLCPACKDGDEGPKLEWADIDLADGAKRRALVCRRCGEAWTAMEGALVARRVVETVYTYALDAPLIRELRELEKHVAQELGQWVDRQRHEVMPFADWTDDELERFANGDGGSGGAEAAGGGQGGAKPAD